MTPVANGELTTVTLTARVNDSGNSNLRHGNARSGCSKNSNPLLTHLPNVSEPPSATKFVCDDAGVPTKPEIDGDGVRDERRMLSCPQCPDPNISVRGRVNLLLADTHTHMLLVP